MDFTPVSSQAFAALGLGAALGILLPVGIALFWVRRKHEPFKTVLVGAVIFFLFVTFLEKPLQGLVITGEHPVAAFLGAHPIWWALVVGLFPGVFEETGRLFAFKAVLKNRKNRETAISYGIGHGGIEVLLLMGVNGIAYLAYAAMINYGAFAAVVEQAAARAPAQAETLRTLAEQLAGYSFSGVGLGLMERAFALLFHIGASILVFYACRDKGRFWLYPLAIGLHTALDFLAGLTIAKVITIPTLALEGIIGVFAILVFGGAYVLLYRRDTSKFNPEIAELPEET